MDIESFFTRDKHNEGAEMRVKDMHGKPTDFYIRLAGLDSDVWREIESDNKREMIRAISGSEIEAKTPSRMLSEVTLGWRGVDIPFSREMAERLYTEAPYIRDQADKFFSKRENFMKPSELGL